MSHFETVRKSAIAYLIVVVSAGCAAQSGSFDIEPISKIVIPSHSDLLIGQTIEVRIDNMPHNQVLRLSLCGQRCNTAYRINTWSGCCHPERSFEPFVLPETGIYYFHIEQFLDDGNTGPPIHVESISHKRRWSTAIFETGTEIQIKLDDS